MRQRARKIKDTQFAAVIHAYMASPQWERLAYNTKDTWARQLRLIEREDTLGGLSVHVIRPALVQAFFDGLSDRPGKQQVALTVLRQVERWAIVRDLLPYPITTGVEFERSREGRRPWTDEQVALAEEFARPDLARVITLAANTGQRVSDLVRMCWTDIEVYKGTAGINVTQKKTGKRLWVPITQELARAMEGWEKAPGPILRAANGGVWSPRTLSSVWGHYRDRNKALEVLAGLTLHGLRATACVRLLRAGANTRQIADMVGMSDPLVTRYTRFSSQRENASAAVLNLDRARTQREHGSDVARKTQG